ncbi:diguanylate cyclase [Tistlia consotensis]|uniref:diguanylate cyclase n=1 Tax=Tistlia consotensis USBA 355 TaxID=560819 RepID=A0A1Y6C4J1_9PROT|nr:GGDEF domain-containing protein [Tistlia consotensis]SMF45409.1 diguanylate cyclase [Tistlia consotensis USBA 355]SNR79926.1 diguanylate cyclase [Tistlia consotensis]
MADSAPSISSPGKSAAKPSGGGRSKAQAESARLAELTLASMKERGIPADPMNYAVWYAYHSGRRPELKRAIDALIEKGERFTATRNEELFSGFFSADRQSETFGATGIKLEAAMARILELVSDASGNAERYGERLENFSGAIERVGERSGGADGQADGELAVLIQGIVEETQGMLERSRALETRLASSSEELAELRHTLQEVRIEATTDGLTGLANRKQFDLSLKLAATAAEESGKPLCLLMTDVDHFKRFNDSFGHRIGDQVLKTLAHILKSGVRDTDTPARYGGEEFAVILPEIDLDDAIALADRLRQALAGKRLTNRTTGADYGTVTISVGVARLRRGETLDDLIARADSALYRAKGAGRNCIVDERDQTRRGGPQRSEAKGEAPRAAG